MPAKGIFDRGELEGACRLEWEADALLHLAAEPLDAAVLDGVLESGMLAVGAVAEIALGR